MTRFQEATFAGTSESQQADIDATVEVASLLVMGLLNGKPKRDRHAVAIGLSAVSLDMLKAQFSTAELGIWLRKLAAEVEAGGDGPAQDA
jgi:hypothetical protein